MSQPKIVIATGGSGGHIYPAIALAQALQELDYDCHFIGQQGGMEAEIVPRYGFAFSGVMSAKWDRAALPDPRIPWRVLRGCQQAWQQLRRLQPQAVIGFGGFASLPAVLASRFVACPLILHEGNSFPGLVTRLFARKAAFTALSFAEAKQYLRKSNTAVVGHPIREQRVSRAEARASFNIPDDALVTLVMGGSQGSLRLNEEVPLAFEQLSAEARVKLVVVHATGKRWYEQMQRTLPDQKSYRLVAYIDATRAWAAADLAITRSGVSTLAEAAFFGVPLMMIPLPSSAENHQLMNARAFAAAGAGEVVEEQQLDTLASTWQHFLQAKPARQAAAQAALALSSAGAAGNFARLIDDFLHPERGHSIVSQFVGRAAPEQTTGLRLFTLKFARTQRLRIMLALILRWIRDARLRYLGMESR